MKIGPNLSAFGISAKGMSVQKKRMDIVAENIANASTTKTTSGGPYKRKFLLVEEVNNKTINAANSGNGFKMDISADGHIPGLDSNTDQLKFDGIKTNIQQDSSVGEMVYNPEHPDADKEGYVQMPNVDVVTEMIDMITSTRNYEANLTAFNASKQIAKDSLEI